MAGKERIANVPGSLPPASEGVRQHVWDLKLIEGELVKHATPLYLLLKENGVSFEDASTIDRVTAAELLNDCAKNDNFRTGLKLMDHYLALLTQHETAKRGGSPR